MSDKKISRKALEEMADITREYYSRGCMDERSDEILARRFELAREIEEGGGPSWFCIENFVSGFFSRRGLKPDISHDEIIAIIEGLGWEVVK